MPQAYVLLDKNETVRGVFDSVEQLSEAVHKNNFGVYYVRTVPFSDITRTLIRRTFVLGPQWSVGPATETTEVVEGLERCGELEVKRCGNIGEEIVITAESSTYKPTFFVFTPKEGGETDEKRLREAVSWYSFFHEEVGGQLTFDLVFDKEKKEIKAQMMDYSYGHHTVVKPQSIILALEKGERCMSLTVEGFTIHRCTEKMIEIVQEALKKL